MASGMKFHRSMDFDMGNKDLMLNDLLYDDEVAAAIVAVITASRAFQPKMATVDDLPTSGLINAHRGCGDVTKRGFGPQGLLSGYRIAEQLGAHILDVDLPLLGDGTTVSFHDPTVDTLTTATGPVADFSQLNFPKVVASRWGGTSWPDEAPPTWHQLLDEFGGRVVLSVEPKTSSTQVAKLAAAVRARGLTRSVLFNCDVTNAALIAAVQAEGMLLHLYGLSTTAHVDTAAAAGAFMVELPYNAAQATVDYAVARIPRVTAAPIQHLSEKNGMTPGLMGYSSDAVGYLDRPTASPTTKSIGRTLAANRRGYGWRPTGGFVSGQLPIAGGGLAMAAQGLLHVGEISGTPATTVTFTLTFKCGAGLVSAGGNNSMRARVLCPQETSTGQDSDTQGYVIGLRANGSLVMWTSNATLGGGATNLCTVAGAALVAGNTYTITLDVTPTTVKLTRVDSGANSGVIANTDWRGDNHFLWYNSAGTDTIVTEFARSV